MAFKSRPVTADRITYGVASLPLSKADFAGAAKRSVAAD
jgi:hypothetical protein